MRLCAIFAASLAGLVQSSACTLTDDDFEPALVVPPMGASDMTAGAALPPLRNSLEPGERAPDVRCGGASELPGCVTALVTPALAPPARDCEGGRCDVNPPRCDDGMRSEGEGGIDCGGSCATRCTLGSTCTGDDDCISRLCEDGICGEPSCDDGRQSPEETDVDCGGTCAPCGLGGSCESGDDCGAGLFCSVQTGRCERPSCQDEVANGSETDADCGGGECPSCPDDSRCIVGRDCTSGVCGSDGRCAAATCDDQVQNQDEAAADCGGSCSTKCETGQGCEGGGDCASGVCGGAGCAPGGSRCCQAPACDDGVRNGSEPLVDCGNADCGLCPLDRPCTESAECSSGFCSEGYCRTHPCEDRELDGTESDVDCGGVDPRCARCAAGDRCSADGDCDGVPCVNGICFGCTNGQLDSNESDVDCGGACGPCDPGQSCQADTDCERGACQDGRCCGGVQFDCTRCARRLAQATLSCEVSQDPVAVDNCNRFLDCLAQHPVECPVRHAPFCSADPGGVCNHLAFGGNGSPGLSLADSVIGTAACYF